jgi:hypothetical protein
MNISPEHLQVSSPYAHLPKGPEGVLVAHAGIKQTEQKSHDLQM